MRQFALLLGLLFVLPSLGLALTQEIPEQTVLIGTLETKFQNWCTKDGSGYSIANWINPNAIYYRVLINPDGTQEFLDMYHFYNNAQGSPSKFDGDMQYETITQQPGRADRIERTPDPLNPYMPTYKTKIVDADGGECGG
ncbi:TPA: hypothetical protein H1016_03320, partial [archaeon]|nr:hypothetical protein [Candidatus Naiadarchaeum limnaeum]